MQQTISPKAINEFESIPVMWVVFVGLLSFGIYWVYWLYTRTQQLNKLHPKPIPFVVMVVVVSIYVISWLVGLRLAQEDTEPSAIANQLLAIMNLVYLMMAIYWVLSFHWKLEDVIQASRTTANNPNQFGFDILFAVLFSVLFFQYKINQAQTLSAKNPISTEVDEFNHSASEKVVSNADKSDNSPDSREF